MTSEPSQCKNLQRRAYLTPPQGIMTSSAWLWVPINSETYLAVSLMVVCLWNHSGHGQREVGQSWFKLIGVTWVIVSEYFDWQLLETISLLKTILWKRKSFTKLLGKPIYSKFSTCRNHTNSTGSIHTPHELAVWSQIRHGDDDTTYDVYCEP